MKKYGVFNFLFDLFMVAITGGVWFLWILLRFLRRNS